MWCRVALLEIVVVESIAVAGITGGFIVVASFTEKSVAVRSRPVEPIAGAFAAEESRDLEAIAEERKAVVVDDSVQF